MDAKHCADMSVYITVEYYRNNVTPYLDAMADNVIWHGPALGQRIEGLANMRAAWGREQNALTFSLGDIEVQYIQTSPSSCEVMLMYVVTTYYPNGDAIPLFQRIQYSWGDCSVRDDEGRRKRIQKIFMVHISNPGEQHSDDFIYPTHFNEIYGGKSTMQPGPSVSLKGMNNAIYVVCLNSVVWAESLPDQHSRVHLRDKTVDIRWALSELEKKTEGHLVRIHSGYLVNPKDVVSVRRFSVTMSDGAELPVPEKKYTAVKKLLLAGSDADSSGKSS